VIVTTMVVPTEMTPEEVLVQVLVVVEVLVDILVVVIVEHSSLISSIGSLGLLEEAFIFEGNIVVHVDVRVVVNSKEPAEPAVGVIVTPMVVTVAPMVVIVAPMVAPMAVTVVAVVMAKEPAPAGSEKAVRTNDASSQVLVCILILIDVLVVVIVESSTAIAATVTGAPLVVAKPA
jgi:hypothetical protein